MQVWVAGVALLNVKVPMVVDTEYPLPLKVTLLPESPWAGVRVMAGVVTVNVADWTTDVPVYTIT